MEKTSVWIGRSGLTCTHCWYMYKIDNWEPTSEHRDLYSMLWDGLNGKEIQKRRNIYVFSSVQSLSRVQLFVTPWTAAHQASLFITNSWSWLKLMCIELVMPSNHLILCHPFLFLPAFNLSQHQGLFKWVSSSHQVVEVLAFQLQHRSFQWTFRTDLL